MKMIYFIISNLIILIPIIYLFRYKGDKFLGINLSKKWVIGLFIVEFIWIIFCWSNYILNSGASIANDFLWHNQFNYYRGVIPMAFVNIQKISSNNTWLVLASTYIAAIFTDFVILRFLSFFKK